MAVITIEYRCADGTPFPVRFASREDAQLTWGFDRLHGRDPETPLAMALGRLGRPGGDRAYQEVGLVTPSIWRTGPEAFGFPYFCQAPMSDDELAGLFEGCGRLVEEYGNAESIWTDYSRPRAEKACAWLQAADLSVPVAQLAEEQQYALHLTMIPAFVSGNDLRLLAQICNDLYGEKGEMVAYELTQGYPNATLEADHAMWRLGRLIGGSSALTRALASADPGAEMEEVRSSNEAAEFFVELDRFLATFGWRGESWDIALPTWREQGDGFWAQLRNMARQGVVSPDEARATAAERRDAFIAEVERRLADDPDQRARFRRRVGRLASYVAVREDRAYWQLVASGSLRTALLRRGADLAARRLVACADDVLYLLPEEIEGAERDFSGVVAERRAEHERWMSVTPPAVIGGIDPATIDQHGAAPGSDGVVRGVPGARGVASGPARVVIDLADADRVQPGDVLVCVMTAPPWTPLFAVAAAVVVDYGDAGSHAAVAAREYGIPCVVGTKVGTAAIPDGSVVRVDGTQGTVEIAPGG